MKPTYEELVNILKDVVNLPHSTTDRNGDESGCIYCGRMFNHLHWCPIKKAEDLLKRVDITELK